MIVETGRHKPDHRRGLAIEDRLTPKFIDQTVVVQGAVAIDANSHDEGCYRDRGNGNEVASLLSPCAQAISLLEHEDLVELVL